MTPKLPTPEAPPPPPSFADFAVQSMGLKPKKPGGFESTIMTGGAGDTSTPNLGFKTLLGQ